MIGSLRSWIDLVVAFSRGTEPRQAWEEGPSMDVAPLCVGKGPHHGPFTDFQEDG
jgi:hypothetical protein